MKNQVMGGDEFDVVAEADEPKYQRRGGGMKSAKRAAKVSVCLQLACGKRTTLEE